MVASVRCCTPAFKRTDDVTHLCSTRSVGWSQSCPPTMPAVVAMKSAVVAYRSKSAKTTRRVRFLVANVIAWPKSAADANGAITRRISVTA